MLQLTLLLVVESLTDPIADHLGDIFRVGGLGSVMVLGWRISHKAGTDANAMYQQVASTSTEQLEAERVNWQRERENWSKERSGYLSEIQALHSLLAGREPGAYDGEEATAT